jgi:hypothetical protein
MTNQDKKNLIIGSIEDLVSDFLYYDRKEDEQMDQDFIPNAVRDGIITVDEMVEEFKAHLISSL